MYVFGYGSLLWKQGFEYVEMNPGFIKGFKRRFWQGSEDHRGAPGKPGRVVSVIRSDDPEDKVWGLGYRIAEDQEATVRAYLLERETGYDIVSTLFYPVDKCGTEVGHPVQLEVFIANQQVDCYLGQASDRDIAWQIYHAEGLGGSNLEYFMRLVAITRIYFTEHCDDHLDKLEIEIRKIAEEKGESLDRFSNLIPN